MQIVYEEDGWITSFLQIKSGLTAFRIQCRYSKPKIETLQFFDQQICHLFKEASKNNIEWFHRRFHNVITISELLHELQDIVNKILHSHQSVNDYSLLIKEIESIGWDKVVNLSSDLNTITLNSTDISGRHHMFTILLPLDYSHTPPLLQVELPIDLQQVLIWDSYSCTLQSCVTLVDEYIMKYQTYMNEMDDIETHTWILEPQKLKSYGITARRIVINESTSIIININAENPRGMCDIKFLGPTSIVKDLHSSYLANMYLWYGLYVFTSQTFSFNAVYIGTYKIV
jgi:E3 ubiquitin-protein ligase FANCL